MKETEHEDMIRAKGSGAPCPRSDEIQRRLADVKSDVDAADLLSHLEACFQCARLAREVGDMASLEDDLRWADRELQNEPHVDINVPLEYLSRLLPAYEFLTEIGRGGMGIVYKVRHRKLDRLMALKVLPRLLAVVRPDAVDRFRREASLAAQLDHSNIVSVHDFDDVDGIFYYTMPFVEGRSLRSLLCEVEGTGAAELLIPPVARTTASSGFDSSAVMSSRSRVARPSRPRRNDHSYFECIAEWIAEIADALQYAHDHGVIHRDIKPANLLLADDGRLMILDFGLATSTIGRELTVSKSLLGTVRYMSPEQVDGDIGSVDARSDIYALGATMYELLTLRPMFAGTDDQVVMSAIRTRDPMPPHKYCQRLPSELETICLKAVDKAPLLRYQSAREMADDLRRWSLGLPIQARRPGLMTRSLKLVKRRPGLTTMATVLAFGILCGGALFAKYRIEKNRTATIQAVAHKQHALLLGIEATDLMQKHQFTEAMQRLEAAVKLAPNSDRLSLTRARLLGRTGRESEAVSELEALARRSPDYWQAHYLLAFHYATQAKRSQTNASPLHREADELTKKAEFHRSEVGRLVPDSAKPLVLEANLQNDTGAALEILDRAAALEGGRIEVSMAQFNLHYANGQYAEALRNADTVIALQPAWRAGYEARASALFALEKYTTAEQTLTHLIKMDPSAGRNWVNRGTARVKLARYADALADLNEAIRLDPEMVAAYIARAKAHIALGNTDQAMADCNRAIDIDPDDKDAFSQRCVIHRRLNQMGQLVADATRIIEIDPDDPLGYQNRSVGLHELRRFDREIADLTKYIRLRPDEPVAFRSRARAYTLIGKGDEALADLTKVIELGPGRFDYYRRANLLLDMGQLTEALPDLSRAIELNADPERMLLKRGMVYEAVGANELARADYDKLAATSGRRAAYGKLARYILSRLLKEDRSEALLPYSGESPFSSWTDQLFGLFRENVTADDLFAAAATDEERCEAYYYIGMKAFLDQAYDEAKVSLQACIAMHSVDCVETHFARLRLELSILNRASR